MTLPSDFPAPDLTGEERSYASQSAVFNAVEVRELCALVPRRHWVPAEVSRPGEVDPVYRSAELSWLQPRDAGWVFERLRQAVEQLNERWFGFDLAGFHDPLQLTRYSADQRGQYDWHTDRGTYINGNPPRKLTVVVQLSESNVYEGGDLELLFGREPLRVDRTQGGLHVFPSFVLHRVTPITSGTRLSLVGWIVGPRFR
jgi:PKHD-type hydroxylase